MKNLHHFRAIILADFLARSAYQMGKTPLLPIFAASLGATGTFLGLIISVSTLTGIILKPIIGVLSDRWGRRVWLIIGTAFFAGMPFFYRLIDTPEQLFIIRLIHGLATAIYGPVTLAYVAEQTDHRRAEQLGIFGMARSAGYVIGPAAAGWLLLVMPPVDVFTLIGFLSCFVFIPIVLLPESGPTQTKNQISLLRQFLTAFKTGSQTPAVWLSGGLEATMYIALYSARVFLPLYALSLDINVLWVGAFFSLQEAVHMAFKPLGGRLGDRLGYPFIICGGMLILGLTFNLLSIPQTGLGLMLLSAAMGSAQAMVFPATVALVSTQVVSQHLGAGMGLIGTLKNTGKVIGPIIGGILLQWLDYALMFRVMGIFIWLGAGLVWYWGLNGAKIVRTFRLMQ